MKIVNKINRKTLAIGCLLALAGAQALAQPAFTRKWDMAVGGSQATTDWFDAMSTDGFGNVYMVGGTRSGPAPNNYYWEGIEARTVKVDRNGAVLWSAAYTGAGPLGAEAMAVDNDVRGNVLVAATDATSTGGVFQSALIKYDADGLQQWVRNQVNFWPKAVKVDATGAAYVAGSVLPSNECSLLKYSAAGVLEWERRLTGTNGNGSNTPLAMALTPSGSVAFSCVTQVAGGANGQQVAVVAANGTVQWQGRHEGNAGGWTSHVLRVDDAGNVVVGGRATTNQGDLLVTKWSAGGTKLWSRSYDGGALQSDELYDLAFDSAGNVHVAATLNSSFGYLFGKVGVVKFAAVDGSVLWARLYGTGSSLQIGRSITVDAAGNALVLAADGGVQTLLRYNAGGTLTGTDSAPANARRIAPSFSTRSAIAVDASGCFVIGGNGSLNGGALDLTLIKYCTAPQNCL